MTGSLWLGVSCAGVEAVEALEHTIYHHIGKRLCDKESRRKGKRRCGMMALASGLRLPEPQPRQQVTAGHLK